jgi:hypothetical protein
MTFITLIRTINQAERRRPDEEVDQHDHVVEGRESLPGMDLERSNLTGASATR